jgi:hypothetical protein
MGRKIKNDRKNNLENWYKKMFVFKEMSLKV